MASGRGGCLVEAVLALAGDCAETEARIKANANFNELQKAFESRSRTARWIRIDYSINRVGARDMPV